MIDAMLNVQLPVEAMRIVWYDGFRTGIFLGLVLGVVISLMVRNK